MGKKQLVIIGLDGLDPLVLKLLLDHLPTFKRLMENGSWGMLTSCDPPITVPAWTAMSTGKTPGELGIYGFTNKKVGSYETFLPDSSAVTAMRAWDYLAASGLSSIILAMPQTAPARPINGLMFAEQLARHKQPLSTWPPQLAKEAALLAGGQYVADTFSHRQGSIEHLFSEAKENTNSIFTLAQNLAKKHFWHLLWLVIMAPDRIQHAALPKILTSNNLAQSKVGAYYRYLDKKLSQFIKKLPQEAPILILSDHGTRPCLGSFWLNRFLYQKGLLKLKHVPKKAEPLTLDLVDWSATKAYGQGGYYGRIYLNIKGRERAGAIAKEAAADLLCQLDSTLSTLKTPWPELPNKVLWPTKIYPTCLGSPPDLMLYAASLAARVTGLVDGEERFWNDPQIAPDQLDKANHSSNGLYIASKELPQEPKTIYDILPLIRAFFA